MRPFLGHASGCTPAARNLQNKRAWLPAAAQYATVSPPAPPPPNIALALTAAGSAPPRGSVRAAPVWPRVAASWSGLCGPTACVRPRQRPLRAVCE